jgi:hypothetical protein
MQMSMFSSEEHHANRSQSQDFERAWLSTSEFHSGAVACSLSDILETGDVPRRFYLSATACRGILRRAEKRGKELPAALKQALESVAGKPIKLTNTAS